MANVFSFFADGMEEVEAITPVDLLRRAGNPVTTVSIMGQTQIRGAHDILIEADVLFEKADFSDGDLFILPGGGEGTQNLGQCEPLMKLLKKKYDEGKRVAAICAAPMLLARLGCTLSILFMSEVIPLVGRYCACTGIRTSSAAVRALIVIIPSEGGQSIRI